MQRTIDDLKNALIFERAVTTHLKRNIADLQKENAELKDRNSTYLLRLKQEEQNREGWQGRALQAEAELALQTERKLLCRGSLEDKLQLANTTEASPVARWSRQRPFLERLQGDER